MAAFESQISGVGSDCSTNLATTAAQLIFVNFQCTLLLTIPETTSPSIVSPSAIALIGGILLFHHSMIDEMISLLLRLNGRGELSYRMIDSKWTFQVDRYLTTEICCDNSKFFTTLVEHSIIVLKWAITSLFFFYFCLFYKQLTMSRFNKSCRWLDSSRGPLVLEATAMPTEPQPLPNFQ